MHSVKLAHTYSVIWQSAGMESNTCAVLVYSTGFLGVAELNEVLIMLQCIGFGEPLSNYSYWKGNQFISASFNDKQITNNMCSRWNGNRIRTTCMSALICWGVVTVAWETERRGTDSNSPQYCALSLSPELTWRCFLHSSVYFLINVIFKDTFLWHSICMCSIFFLTKATVKGTLPSA